jgi:AraC-like DNA-binding protein
MEPFVVTTGDGFAGVWAEIPNWWIMELCQGQVSGAGQRMDGRRGATIVLRTTLSILLEDERGPDETNDLVDLFGAVLARNLLAGDMGAAAQEGQADRVSRFVSANYRTPGLSPRDAARDLGCSVSSIHKCCASVGWTFGGLVTSMRLSVAAYRLSRIPQSISEVAFDCGFASLSHFCHAFKAYYGVTASSVRKQHAITA